MPAIAFAAAFMTVAVFAVGPDQSQAVPPKQSVEHSMQVANPMRMPGREHHYAGMWVTADGHIRHELLPNGRYDEARGKRKSAYQGRYWLEGDHIEYVDDTGFTADGDFRGGVLYHAGMVLYREDGQ